jgi:hypothetical protein
MKNNVDLGIMFTDTTTYAFIYTFLSELKLNILYINVNNDFEIYMRVDSGNYSDYLAAFLKDSSVAWDMKSYPLSYPDLSTYILVRFNNEYSYQSSQHALKLINSLHGLTVIEVFASISDAGIEVPEEQEQEWIKILQSYPFVSKVELPTAPPQPI